MRVFLGYDPSEDIAYKVARFSIEQRSSGPVYVSPIVLSDLQRSDLYRRPTFHKDNTLWDLISDAPMSTEFAISRFFIPYLVDGDRCQDWVLFADSDIVCNDDILKILDYANPQYAIVVVHHKQTFQSGMKKVNRPQTSYPFKNWSSVILWNVRHKAHQKLTLDYLNSTKGRDLHAFSWLDRDEIGSLPPRWNHLVNVEPMPEGESPAIWHFTLGGPWLAKWEPKLYDDVWKREREALEVALEAQGCLS